jgi:hypothetical protein
MQQQLLAAVLKQHSHLCQLSRMLQMPTQVCLQQEYLLLLRCCQASGGICMSCCSHR